MIATEEPRRERMICWAVLDSGIERGSRGCGIVGLIIKKLNYVIRMRGRRSMRNKRVYATKRDGWRVSLNGSTKREKQKREIEARKTNILVSKVR